MRFLQNCKYVAFQGPTTVATNATSSAYVDTIQDGISYRYACILSIAEPAAATNSSAKYTSLRLLHGAVTNISSGTAVATLTGTTEATATTAQFVIGTHNDTLVGSVTPLFVDCQGLERYLTIEKRSSSVGWDGNCDVAILTNGTEAPDTAALRAGTGGGQGLFP